MRFSVGILKVNIYYSACAELFKCREILGWLNIAKETFDTLKSLKESFSENSVKFSRLPDCRAFSSAYSEKKN